MSSNPYEPPHRIGLAPLPLDATFTVYPERREMTFTDALGEKVTLQVMEGESANLVYDHWLKEKYRAAAPSALETAINLLSANPPEYVTPGDIMKARKAARRQYRQDLRDAVKGLLLAQPVNVHELVQSAFAEIVAKTTKQVETKLTSKGADNLLDAEIKRLVAASLGRYGAGSINAAISEQVKAYAEQAVKDCVLVTIKDHW